MKFLHKKPALNPESRENFLPGQPRLKNSPGGLPEKPVLGCPRCWDEGLDGFRAHPGVSSGTGPQELQAGSFFRTALDMGPGTRHVQRDCFGLLDSGVLFIFF